MTQDDTEVPAKRNDPNYMQVSGDVPKQTGLEFKSLCTLRQLSLGEGLEQAMKLWIENQNKVQVNDHPKT